MGEQLIISVGREFGSGGHVIAEALAERGIDVHQSGPAELAVRAEDLGAV